MDNLIGSNVGLVHLISALVAVITGVFVLIVRKGTKQHVKIGYVYVASMLVLNVTAFMTYRLFGGFGIFHYAAIASTLTLIGGMIPVIQRKKKGWIYRHFSFMYWSVIGLYAAFASEALTRIPETPFFGMVGIATAGIMLLGTIIFVRFKKTWQQQFASLA
ncbi:DUF2306 domain-containing protein [Roseivirga misakiensis]|uniref:DUF2306 domain-containing protein n=1 Tax=Roseivirga misakiensis TaxID=1563681 RepID=A0A1E5T6F5_9BACT|nr:DUF2306 domain-containing protein [Roseivirga misakiensis]OEK06940.1 hypothetical protein BFP71_04600 [Roseivirga misakiensis]